MALFWALFVVAHCGLGLVLSQPSPPYYVVVGPEVLRPNSAYDVGITLLGTSEPATVKVAIEGRRDSGGIFAVRDFLRVEPYNSRILRLPIEDIGPGSYNLTIEGDNSFPFYNTSKLSFLDKYLSIFVQTDKAIYKPGHKVMFRILLLDNRLVPAQVSKFDIFVTDGKGNRVREWRQVSPTRGVFASELELSSSPVLGDWKITVSAGGQETSKVFTVAEYVLPKFEVIVEAPQHVSRKDSKFPVTIKAKYTYGKPVKGEATILAHAMYYSDVLQPLYRPPVRKLIPIDGKAWTEFDVVKELELTKDYERIIKFEVTVEEELTGRKQNSSAETIVHLLPYKLELAKTSEYFKPGLKYTAFLKLVNHDGTPVLDKTNQIKVRSGYSYETQELNETLHPVPSNGFIELNFYPPTDAKVIAIEAEYQEAKEWFSTVSPANSPSNTFIQAVVKTTNPKVNDDVEIEVNSTEDLSVVSYQVLGRGNLIIANSVAVQGKRRTAQFRFLATSAMAPTAHLIVEYINKDGEVVADALDIELDGALQNFVKVDASPNEAEPGNSVSFSIETKPNSYVGLMGIDQSVLLLKKGNDLSKDDVLEELRSYDSSSGGDSFRPFLSQMERVQERRSAYWYPGSLTAHQAFQKSGAIILTNAYVNDHSPWLFYRGIMEDTMSASSFLDSAHELDQVLAESGFMKESPRVRSHFPETWIWDMVDTGYNGKTSFTKVVPDTITSWIVTAYSVDPLYGLGLIESPTKVKVFRPFFVSLDLPYSVVRGETIAIPVVVFNYMNSEIVADVTLENSGQFDFADLSNDVSDQPRVELYKRKKVTVAPNTGASTSFMIVAKDLGYVDIKVTARSSLAGDTVVRKLLVKPEGETQYKNKAVFVDLRSDGTYKTNVTLDIPVNIVSGSEVIEVSAVGDILGPSLPHLEKLIQMPYGCGEQNMLNFVPNIVILNYLRNTRQLTQAIETKSIRYMELGYQQELTYKHNDHSFSAFGNTDPSGSTWLTAFVAKSFVQATKYIKVEDSVIAEALGWLAEKQSANGSFPEVGTVSHKSMQGGAANGLALTAYTLTAFLEATSITDKYRNTINKAIDYVDRQIRNGNVEDVYSIALATYALELAQHPSRDQSFGLLESKAQSKDGMKWWKKPEQPGDGKNPNALLPNSIQVEMTAYALLSYIERGLIKDSIPIMKWLVGQQNDQGGFASTQDTVVALGALAKLAERIAPGNLDVNVNFEYAPGVSRDIHVTQGNAMILQKSQLPGRARAINITATGRGIAVVQVSYKYNVNVTGPWPLFHLDPQVDKNSNVNHLQLSICSSFTAGNASNMAVMEVTLPSGYTIDKDSLPSLEYSESVKRVETKDGDTVVMLYFDKMTAKELCPTVSAFLTHKVANQRPAPVTLYDYYDQSRRARVFYEAHKASPYDICDQTDEDCRRIFGDKLKTNPSTGGKGSATSLKPTALLIIFFTYLIK